MITTIIIIKIIIILVLLLIIAITITIIIKQKEKQKILNRWTQSKRVDKKRKPSHCSGN